MLQLYKNIKTRRTELRLTQSELADKMGYADKSMIAKIEKGAVDLPQSKIFAFAKALETTPLYLMGLDEWDKESQQLEDKISAFYHQLKGLGWSYEWLDTEKMYLLSNETTSIKITAEEYGKLVDESEEFCRKQLQKLLLKSSSLLLNAAHERTDIEVTEEMKKHDDDIMNDDSEWE